MPRQRPPSPPHPSRAARLGTPESGYCPVCRLSNFRLFDRLLTFSLFLLKRIHKEHFVKTRLLLFAVIAFAISLATAISFAQRKPDTDQPIRGDFKTTIKTNMAGQERQSTTMIKGLRERSEMSMGGMNMGMVSVTQCDLKRTIQINDRVRKYLITPMESDDSASGPSSGGGMGAATG